MKNFLISLVILMVSTTSAFAEGLISDDTPPGSELNWSVPIYAETYLPNANILFDDVTEADWFYDDVTYIVNCKIMEGYDSVTFAPHDKATEAMMVTVLYRMAGSPVISADSEEWYAAAVKWGYMNGVIDSGENWKFEPDKHISRGIFACMLANFNENIEKKSSDGDASIFPDSADFPGYAQAAAGWAGKAGIITGRDGGEFDFYGEAARAELAAMLHRYIAG